MKNLLYKNETFYLCDEEGTKGGQTCVVSNYTPIAKNMPHKHKDFKENIIVYARPSCPFCIDFLSFLKKYNKKTHHYDNLIYIEVDSHSPKDLFSKSNLLKNLKKELGSHSTVPMVFHKGKFVGGNDESKTYFNNLYNK